jgi:hypothetical protein
MILERNAGSIKGIGVNERLVNLTQGSQVLELHFTQLTDLT